MIREDKYIRFDWAMKRLLRNKANFAVLEGLLTTLLGEKITIRRLLESESNQEEEFDKYNRVDMLAEDANGRLLLIEVQNNNEYAYFQRMLFGTSKLVTEYINRGDSYSNIRKVYSVNIVYFSLGHGKDYVYHGKTEFRGIHLNDVLELSPFQRQKFEVDAVSQLYPEYYILKVNDFNKVMDAIRYLREKELSTVESLDAYLDTVSGQAVSIRAEMKPKEKRMKEVDTMLSHIANFEAHKPVHTEYAAIRFKKPKEQFAAAHRDELDAYNAAVRYFKVHLEGTKYSTKKLNEERTQLAGEVAEYRERLSAVQEDVKILRDVRHWLNQVLPSEQYRQTAEPGKKPSIQQAVKGRAQRIREEQAEKRQQPRTEKKQDMEL